MKKLLILTTLFMIATVVLVTIGVGVPNQGWAYFASLATGSVTLILLVVFGWYYKDVWELKGRNI